MNPKQSAGGTPSRARWDAQVVALNGQATRRRREPLTVARIIATALDVVKMEGYDALTTRRLAGALGATPGALYAHVTDKAELDDLMVSELCSRIVVPEPDPSRWLAQVTGVCRQLRDQYLAYPGLARASFDTTPHSLEAWRINEGMLAILTAAGVPLRAAAWSVDAAFLYIGAYSVVSLRRSNDGDSDETASGVLDRAEIVDRFRALPLDHFPIMSSHADEITAGEGHERFDATLELMFGGLAGPAALQGELS